MAFETAKKAAQLNGRILDSIRIISSRLTVVLAHVTNKRLLQEPIKFT
jgi:hypothetical protein